MTRQEGNITLTAPMLKAMANPLRRKIFDALGAMGSARASDLAELLSVAANKVSFHLRELAKAELIEEAPELARDKRDRVWRTAAKGYTTGEPAERPSAEGDSAMNAYLDQIAFDEQRRIAAALAHAKRHYASPELGAAKALLSTSNLMLTKDEAQALNERIEALIPAFREELKAGEIASSQPESERTLWHFSGLLSADELLNESQERSDAAQSPK
ncbi:helix-turn-helix domain-containing protein [Glutamicibacter sp. PS]|uniref:ArsR/SmtB family transcription factor n=1 Tax=Glutamicibacter sp. PS TaxID=3075634 RepID=UPI00283E1649|nr:helix-turn-helix domain-containing protein [Glutamicibacter sp. PS]MDR4532705.1 helix-turn-helix domain-containing protein [Glutamicibacter sp. PS]